MVLLDTADAFFDELEQMFALCKERGAGTVYSTVKKVEAGNKQQKKNGQSGAQGTTKEAAGGGGRREGWLVRAKISNSKKRKISLLAIFQSAEDVAKDTSAPALPATQYRQIIRKLKPLRNQVGNAGAANRKKVSDAEIVECRERLEAVRKSMPVCALAGATKKRGRKPAGGGAAGANIGKRLKGASGI